MWWNGSHFDHKGQEPEKVWKFNSFHLLQLKEIFKEISSNWKIVIVLIALVVELAYTVDSESTAARIEGSSPSQGTKFFKI